MKPSALACWAGTGKGGHGMFGIRMEKERVCLATSPELGVAQTFCFRPRAALSASRPSSSRLPLQLLPPQRFPPAPSALPGTQEPLQPSAAAGAPLPAGEEDEVRARWRYGQQRGSGCSRAAEKSTEGSSLLADALYTSAAAESWGFPADHGEIARGGDNSSNGSRGQSQQSLSKHFFRARGQFGEPKECFINI
ncbi:TRAF-interacting protein with FHA domain-containing protein A isoform X4 [Motacilla alba alba]|uniref:TRAF-interacting protein with FHA domain-containing protein A isoform X4 n=1 Tax=Motacilla alba alba TaxID=1094192 RepID=UPI0018D52983|nr:TRAF-interacting protein with FHA domain-containing protein A isoform X4 [Motacilla alba alba]